MRISLATVCFLLVGGLRTAPAQVATPASGPTIDLAEALSRAHKYGLQVQGSNTAAELAKEDRAQAKAAALPAVNAFNQFIYTEGNGTPSGVFIANNRVHVYNEQAHVHQEPLAVFPRGEIRRAEAAQTAARAKVDVATHGLNLTVAQNYYAIVSAQRQVSNAQTTLQEAAHTDVVEAQLQVRQRERDVQDAQLAVEKAKVGLADLQKAALLPPCPEVQARATETAPISGPHASACSKPVPASVCALRLSALSGFRLVLWH